MDEDVTKPVIDMAVAEQAEHNLLRGALVHLLYGIAAWYQFWLLFVAIAVVYILMSLVFGGIAKRAKQ